MGRQAYLTRLALGRSAFEPSQSTTQSPDYVQLESSQQELPPELQHPGRNRHVQVYDERGNPINPRAREYGRRSREAQNDVLAAIGVVEKRPSPSDSLPGTYEEQLQQLENEDSVGNFIALSSTLSGNLCTWWVGSLRDRILTFRFRDSLHFSQIVASEYQVSTNAITYAGFVPRLLSTVGVQATVYMALVFRPLDNLLFRARAARKTRQLVQRWRHVINDCFRLIVEIAYYPFAYHANLQRLGLIPARPLLPSWGALIPFSSSSPISAPSANSALELCQAASYSPLVWVCLEHFLERWAYAAIYEAIESTVLRPENPDLISPDDGVKDRANAILGLRRKSPLLLRISINRMLVALGWGRPFPHSETREQLIRLARRAQDLPDRIDLDPEQVTDGRQHELPIADHESLTILGYEPSAAPALSLPHGGIPAASPTASEASQNGDDPRIRITSREGIVEMEVRLPPHVLSTHTEVADVYSEHQDEDGVAAPAPVPERDATYYHRVTQLSTEPAQMIGAICKAQLLVWAVLPLKLVALRLIASHYLANASSNMGNAAVEPYRSIPPPFGTLNSLSLRSIGTFMSRVALSSALGFAVDLTLWGCQWAAVTWMGKQFFGWGTL
ncbi:hypothetical protein BDV96DRAFT_503666 [Lophiotrema nucula]|uniref:Uncharacterized protein n=1 Tax=Lophiotrema nucula TaxID=690887 RepID=A0A6A5YQT4_9PLEO|nr:hypothetical protein BDV96DRAFT_503666 [Lophiotrema nucula]